MAPSLTCTRLARAVRRARPGAFPGADDRVFQPDPRAAAKRVGDLRDLIDVPDKRREVLVRGGALNLHRVGDSGRDRRLAGVPPARGDYHARQLRSYRSVGVPDLNLEIHGDASLRV